MVVPVQDTRAQVPHARAERPPILANHQKVTPLTRGKDELKAAQAAEIQVDQSIPQKL